MCSLCHELKGVKSDAEIELTAAREHGDGNPVCLRIVENDDFVKFLMCVDCGEVVKYEGHCCYE